MHNNSSASRIEKARAKLADLPPAIQGEGGNNKTFHAACILAREDVPIEESLPLMHEYNERAEPPWEEAELLRLVESAYKSVRDGIGFFEDESEAAKTGMSKSSKVALLLRPGAADIVEVAKRFTAGVHPGCWGAVAEPEDDVHNGGIHFVRTLFRKEEMVNIINDATARLKPYGYGVFHRAEEWTEEDLFPPELTDLRGHRQAGAWIRINPVDGAGISDANVTALRHVLVEGDKLPVETQSRILWRLRELGLPIVALTHSGGKSLHALVRVDCETLEEYRQTAGRLLSALALLGADPANKNPSRLSRLPGVKRGKHWQRLLFLSREADCNSLTLETLEKIEKMISRCAQAVVEVRQRLERANGSEIVPMHDLGACLVHASKLATMNIPPRHRLLANWLCQGDLGYVFAPRGVGKTWFVMALAAAISQAKAFGLWPAGEEKAPVLYVDGEMPLELTKHRSCVLSLAKSDVTYLHHEVLFEKVGSSLNIGLDSYRIEITELLVERAFKVLILDNLSALASGVVENKGEDYEPIGDWLLDLRRRKITVIVVHHAGRNGQMRGHSKREDACSWILELQEAKADGDEGAKFVSHFAKPSRNTGEPVPDYQWHFTTNSESKEAVIECEMAQTTDFETFIRHVTEGVEQQADLADLMKKPKGTISKWAKKAVAEGRIRRTGQRLLPLVEAQQETESDF